MTNTQAGKVKEFFRRGFKKYGIDALSAMAMGLFSSLIIGLIISQLAKIPFLSFLEGVASMVAASSPVVGAAIGVAIAHGLGSKPLVIFSSAVTGAVGYGLTGGGPVGAYVGAVIGAEFGNRVAGKTPVDIVLVPIVTIITGGLAGQWVGAPVASFMTWLGSVINNATQLAPVPMGIAVSTLMGMILTLPISSAAIAISLGLSGLAAGASAVGCATQMIGFAVMSYRENRMGGLIAQGLGTSMLQVPNILKKPIIWIPPTLASAILGPISTRVVGMVNNAVGAGMGTSGLLGPIAAWQEMSASFGSVRTLVLIALFFFILPAVLTLAISELMRKLGWIKGDDLKLALK